MAKPEHTTCSTTVELSRTEYGKLTYVTKDIRFTRIYHCDMNPYKGLKRISYMFEIRKKFIFIPYWKRIGKYWDYQEGINIAFELLKCI